MPVMWRNFNQWLIWLVLYLVTPSVLQITCLIPYHSHCITDHLSYTLSLPLYHRPLVLYLVTPSVSQTTCLTPCHSQCITDHLSYTLSLSVYHRPLDLYLFTPRVSQTTCLTPCHSPCITDHLSYTLSLSVHHRPQITCRHPALSCAAEFNFTHIRGCCPYSCLPISSAVMWFSIIMWISWQDKSHGNGKGNNVAGNVNNPYWWHILMDINS